MACEHKHISKILSGNWSREYIESGLTYHRYRCYNCDSIGVQSPRELDAFIDWNFELKHTGESLHDKLRRILDKT